MVPALHNTITTAPKDDIRSHNPTMRDPALVHRMRQACTTTPAAVKALKEDFGLHPTVGIFVDWVEEGGGHLSSIDLVSPCEFMHVRSNVGVAILERIVLATAGEKIVNANGVIVLFMLICRCAVDPSPCQMLERMNNYLNIFRRYWLLLDQSLGYSVVPISVHLFATHLASSVARFGGVGTTDSAQHESGQKRSKMLALMKTNHQKESKRVKSVNGESGETETTQVKPQSFGEDFNLQIVRAACVHYVMDAWHRRMFINAPPLLQDDNGFGMHRVVHNYLNCSIKNWNPNVSVSELKKLFPEIELNFADIGDDWASGLFGTLTMRVFDKNRVDREIPAWIKSSLPYPQGEIVPKDVVHALSPMKEKGLLVWDPSLEDNNPSCFGCSNGLRRSSLNANTECYGIPLGFSMREERAAVVVEILPEPHFEPALFMFAPMHEGGEVEEIENCLGSYFRDLNPVVKLIPLSKVVGSTSVFYNVQSGGASFFRYRETGVNFT